MNHIYKITNKINGKCYIGLTTQGINRRWSEHVYRFNLGERDHKLYQAMRKYGIDNFNHEVIFTVFDKNDLADLEILFIQQNDSFNHGYNMTCGGDIVSDETKKKLSSIFRGRKITWYNKILESRRNNPNPRDPKEWAKFGADHIKAKSYMVRYPDGHIDLFTGLRDFCRKNGLSHNLLLTTLSGKQSHHKGFVLLQGSTTIPQGSTAKRLEMAHGLHSV